MAMNSFGLLIFVSMVCAVRGQVLLPCIQQYDSERKLGLLNFVDVSASMAGLLPQLTDDLGVIYKLFQSARIDDSRAGLIISNVQDKNTPPFGDAGDVCDEKVLKCITSDPTSCGVWSGVTAGGGGDDFGDQLGAIHHRLRGFNPNVPNVWRIIVVLYTNSRPHLKADGPPGFNPVPTSGNYACQTTEYVSVEELNTQLVNEDATLVAIVKREDVEFYKELFESLTVPYAVRPWGDNSDETLNRVLGGIDDALCDGRGRDGVWDSIKKMDGSVALNATSVQQVEKGASHDYGKAFGMAVGGNVKFRAQKTT